MTLKRLRPFAAWPCFIFWMSSAMAGSPEEDFLRAAVATRAENRLIRGIALIRVAKDAEVSIFHGDGKNRAALYEVGSLSKTWTAFAAAQLAIEHRLDFQAPLRRYLPELAGSFAGEITPHQLATHTSRLTNGYRSPSGSGGNRYSTTELIVFLKNYRPDAAEFPVGRRVYSNVGFAVLGLVLSRIEGRPITEILRDRVFRKVGMAQATFITSAERPAGLLPGYDSQLSPRPYLKSGEVAVAAGGVAATIEDLRKFLRVSLSPPENDLGSAIRLTQRMGYGFDSLAGEVPTWKFGAMSAGFTSLLRLDLERRVGVIALTNVLNSEMLLELGAVADHLEEKR